MSAAKASGGASALNGSWWIIVRAARCCVLSSAVIVIAGLLRWRGSFVGGRAEDHASEVGVLEVWVAVLVERTDPLDPVRVHGRAPVGVHHDRDGLLERLSLAQLDRALHCLDCGGRV